MNIFFKKATVGDIETLVKLRIDFLLEMEKPELENGITLIEKSLQAYFLENIPNENFIAWLALNDEGTAVGTSGICFYRIPPTYGNVTGLIGYIMNMYTVPEYRRKGIASDLFSKIMEEGIKKSVKKLVLHATREGKSLYHKNGFIEKDGEMVFLK